MRTIGIFVSGVVTGVITSVATKFCVKKFKERKEKKATAKKEEPAVEEVKAE